jgi:hypothetical protein
MKPKTQSIVQVLFFLLLVPLLAACGSHRQFVVPEIDPPSDLIPGYVPDGFKLVKGYQIKPEEFEASRFFAGAEDCNEDTRLVCGLGLSDSFFDLQSPAGNDILGLHYQDGDNLLLVTKSYYPGGSLDLWRAAYEASYKDDLDCGCNCFQFAMNMPFPPLPLRFAEIQEVHTVGETQVAVLDGPLGLIAVFMRGDYLVSVEGDLTSEELLRIVESLLQ